MNGKQNSPSEGENDVAPNTITEPYSTDLSEADRVALSDRLHDLADQLHDDIHELADRTRDTSEEIPVEEALDLRESLSEIDRTVRVELDAIPSNGDRIAHGSRGRSGSEPELDTGSLSPASEEELSKALEADLDQLRTAVERASRGLVTESLTDEEASDVWDGAARIESWGRDVLTFRIEEYVEVSEEERKAAREPPERADEVSIEELGI
jgi:hypothetical protein